MKTTTLEVGGLFEELDHLGVEKQLAKLPDVDNTWHRANADLQYFFTARAGVGVGYYFEKLDVVDFNTIDEPGPINPPIAPRTA